MDTKYITKLNPADVLFGRGSGPNDHEGNIRFREYVAERKAEYMATNHRQTKAKIAKEIVDAVYARNGRFLKKLEANEAIKVGFSQGVDAYVVADENTVMEKAKQALRQNRDKVSKPGDSTTSPKRERLSPVPSHSPMGLGMQGMAAGMSGQGGPNIPDLSGSQEQQMLQQQYHQPQQLYGNLGFPVPQTHPNMMSGMDANSGFDNGGADSQQILPIPMNVAGMNNQMQNNYNNMFAQMQQNAPMLGMNANYSDVQNNMNRGGMVSNDTNSNDIDPGLDGQVRESEFQTYTTTLADPQDERKVSRSSAGARDAMQWMNDTNSHRGSLSGAVLGIGNGRRGGSFLRRSDPPQGKPDSAQISDVFGGGKRESLQVSDVFAFSNVAKRASSITAASMQMSELMESFKGMSTAGDFQSDDDTIDTIDPIGMGPHHMSGLSSMSVMSISSATSLFKPTESSHSRVNGGGNGAAKSSAMYGSDHHIKEEEGEDQNNNDQHEDQGKEEERQQHQHGFSMEGQTPHVIQGRPSDISSGDPSRLSANLRLSNLEDMSWAASAAANGSIRQSINPQDLWNTKPADGMMRGSLQSNSGGGLGINPRPLGSMQEHPDSLSGLGSSSLSFMRGAAQLESLENIGEEGQRQRQDHRSNDGGGGSED